MVLVFWCVLTWLRGVCVCVCCACGLGLDVSYFTACLTASIWSWDSVTAAFTPLSPYTHMHVHTHKYRCTHSEWQLCHPVTDLLHPPAANGPEDEERWKGWGYDRGCDLRPDRETDTGTDKTPKGWRKDGQMSKVRAWFKERPGEWKKEKMGKSRKSELNHKAAAQQQLTCFLHHRLQNKSCFLSSALLK